MPVNNVVLRGSGATITLDDNTVLNLTFEYDETTGEILVDGLLEKYRQDIVDYFVDPTNYQDIIDIFPWFNPSTPPSDLGIGFITTTNLEITNTNGLNVVLPPVNSTEAGLMIATDKIKLNGIEPLAKDGQNAFEVPVSPSGNLGSTDVQNALVELQTDIDNLFAFTGPVNFIAGSGAPIAATGSNGDYYIDVVTGDIYGPKTLGAWGGTIGNAYLVPLATVPPPASTNIVGTAGVSTSAAREDHQHPVQQADVTPVAYSPLNYAIPASGDVEAHLEEIDIQFGLIPSIPIIKASLAFTGSVNVATADLNVGLSSINTLAATTGATTVNIPVNGIYDICCNLSFTGAVQRANLGIAILVNGTGATRRHGGNYLRSTNGHNESGDTYVTSLVLSAGDTVGVQLSQQAAAGTVNIDNSLSDITIKLIQRL